MLYQSFLRRVFGGPKNEAFLHFAGLLSLVFLGVLFFGETEMKEYMGEMD